MALTLQEHKCKNCGYAVDVSAATGGVAECPRCFSRFTLSKSEDARATEFLRMGEHELDVCRFDDAYAAFAKAAECDGKEPEAYFGMALAEFKIQYLSDAIDPDKALTRDEPCRMQPICHRVTDKKFTENKNFKKAFALATTEQKAEYAAKAKEIDYILREFFALEKSGLDYDCFICVKVTDGNAITRDSAVASDLYYKLKDKGYKPFFSERELGGFTGADYETRILYALQTAECMIVVCSDAGYLQTKWVKNEYTRFMGLINDERKETDSIAIAWFDKVIETLPGRNGKLQGVSINSPDAYAKIYDFVQTHTPLARAKRAAEEKARRKEADEIKRQIELQKQQQRELESRLEQISANSNSGEGGGATATASSLITRGTQELSARHFEKARGYFDRVLDAEPNNSAAWWGLFLVDFNAEHEDKIPISVSVHNAVLSNTNYINADGNAKGAQRERIDEFKEKLFTAPVWWDLFLRDLRISDDGLESFVRRNSADALIEYTNNPNLVLAQKYADEEWQEYINSFIRLICEKCRTEIKGLQEQKAKLEAQKRTLKSKSEDLRGEYYDKANKVSNKYISRVKTWNGYLDEGFDPKIVFWVVAAIVAVVSAIALAVTLFVIGSKAEIDFFYLENAWTLLETYGVPAFIGWGISEGILGILFEAVAYGVVLGFAVALLYLIIRGIKRSAIKKKIGTAAASYKKMDDNRAELNGVENKISSINRKIADNNRFLSKYKSIL